MEPEIIRMYSSSPPPLDSVADDDDEDEFGDFGGFSGVGNSGIGFADFETISYPKSEEDQLPAKHFRPIEDYSKTVNNFPSLTTVKDAGNILEMDSKNGHCGALNTDIGIETKLFNAAAFDSKGSSGENIKEVDLHSDSENILQSEGSTEFVFGIQEPSVGTCNGEKAHCPENLTNGFAECDSVNPKEKEYLDRISDSEGVNEVTTNCTDVRRDILTHTDREFEDFSSFSKKDSGSVSPNYIDSYKDLNEGQTLSITNNSPLSSIENDISHINELVSHSSSNRDEINNLVIANCTSETDQVMVDNVAPVDNVHTTENVIVESLTTNGTVIQPRGGEKVLQTIDDIGYTALDSLVENTEIVKHVSNKKNECINDGLHHLTSVHNLSKAASANLLSSQEDLSEFNNFEGTQDTQADDFGDFSDNAASFQDETKPDVEERLTDVNEKYSQTKMVDEGFNEFGDFGLLQNTDESNVQEYDDFADFSSAGNAKHHSDWNAFEDDQSEGSTWAAFSDDKPVLPPSDSEAWHSHRTDQPSSSGNQDIKTENMDLHLIHEPVVISEQDSFQRRLEQIVLVCFPLPRIFEVEETITSLDELLKGEAGEESEKSLSSIREVLDIWVELQDIHDAHGLKHQWGGSHSNKKLLCSLGIDTRNILFTGNKKQPVIVPMYAASLGMLEPTKEPLKPLSAAEKIASIGQSSPVPPEENLCTSDQMQETLPPVQFDWSSSGLTNPLDGVDPELYELTTSKMECVVAGNKVTDAFARLMSTAETTSTSARNLRRDENLSEEAAKVIASLPDLSFMHAKVLMFPATLTPSSIAQN
ncbi:hypothetical protein GDO86_009213 [Hymenochirus boettgeri]|uniref:Aftiphilin clathrin-binding box domain-containing protein n=1 Tax=Hymenochirus boettgeri TaxID=247094 RepID=A0A8T2JKS9_9PIPI|nr:hypothetical protein GDO86_009213 [Hymenochirus boettgeri]KAG8443930.1 hypothetical protein GDO86_009213 [Hymenochirus boettgeri]